MLRTVLLFLTMNCASAVKGKYILCQVDFFNVVDVIGNYIFIVNNIVEYIVDVIGDGIVDVVRDVIGDVIHDVIGDVIGDVIIDVYFDVRLRILI